MEPAIPGIAKLFTAKQQTSIQPKDSPHAGLPAQGLLISWGRSNSAHGGASQTLSRNFYNVENRVPLRL